MSEFIRDCAACSRERIRVNYALVCEMCPAVITKYEIVAKVYLTSKISLLHSVDYRPLNILFTQIKRKKCIV